MDYTEGGTDGIYLPVKPLFDTPIYRRAQQTCWHAWSYKRQVTLMVEFLRLHRSNQLPPEMTVDDITDLIQEMERASLRVEMWQFELEEYKKEPEVLALLDLVWQVTASLKFSDVAFEAGRILSSSDGCNASAGECARKRAETWQRPSSSAPLTPREMALKLVPKVVQDLWRPPPDTDVIMPSQYLANMAVGLTKAVEHQLAKDLTCMDLQAAFSRANRDAMVLSILDTVTQLYAQDVLEGQLSCFAPELLRQIARLAADAIRRHFEPQPDCGGSTENQDSGLEEDTCDTDAGDSLPGNYDTEVSTCPPEAGPTNLTDSKDPTDWNVSADPWPPAAAEPSTLLWSTVGGNSIDNTHHYPYAGPVDTSTCSWLHVATEASSHLRSKDRGESIDSTSYYAYAGPVDTSSWFPVATGASALPWSADSWPTNRNISRTGASRGLWYGKFP